MEVATGAISTLLPKLTDLIKEEYKLQKKVRGEIMFLKAELESMQAALIKVSEAPVDEPPDIQVKLWARDVRDLSYDIEDYVDTFMVRVDARAPKQMRGFMGFIDRSIHLMKKASTRRKIGIDVKDIKGRITEVSQRRDRYKVDNVVAKPIGTTIDNLRQKAIYKEATKLVGTEEKSADFVKRLMDDGDEVSKNKLKIVSIVGFGGLGKTTLAKIVYDKLKVQFNCGAFVPISVNPNMGKIFKSMLHQIDKSKYSNVHEQTWGEGQLINELRELLQHKRYLIVVDDIWEKSVWETIKCALVENEYGSRIITTTRILDVAMQVSSVYQIEPLSLLDSTKLFYQRIFGNEDKSPPHLAKVSEKILKKCGGVPLAIITIASLLAGKKDKENIQNYWSVYHLMGSGLEDSHDVRDMRRILSVSYYDLPPHLKTCLLYLSFYPEDYDISREDLIWKWVGECFVHNKKEKSLHGVGEDYFDELINRSMIQPTYFDIHNKASHCRVHDMVLDLINSFSNEQHFITTLGGHQSLSLPNKIRRLSVQSIKEEDVKQLSTMNLSHVRSLIVSKQAFNLLPALSSFPVLRVLDLSHCGQVDDQHCKDICNLFHLRYLNLYATNIKEIPKEIENLQFLQVLNIDWTKIQELPSTFVQLGQLVCLHLPRSLRRLPDGFGTQPIQEFLRIEWKSLANRDVLVGLSKLRRLTVSFYKCDDSSVKAFSQCLSNLVSLEILEVDGGFLVNLDSGCDNLLPPGPQRLWCINMSGCLVRASGVPRWMPSLSSLSRVSIRIYMLTEKDLRVLSNIPSLSWLRLEVWGKVKCTADFVIDSSYPFRCLTWLEIDCADMLQFAPGAMQKLKTLSVLNPDACWQDCGVENLPSLEHILFSVHCEREQLNDVMAEFREILDTYPNQPTFVLRQWW